MSENIVDWFDWLNLDKSIIGCTGGKGGTGKTTVAVNIAYLFSESGKKVLMLDCDVDNPNVEVPLGIVAMHKDRVIGFRGYFATRFEIPDKTNNLIVLVAGDTCVHPEFRRKGLSVLMGNLAADAFSGDYRLFLNMTTTASSLPGYLKLGFQPITKKTYLSQYAFPGLIRYLLNYKMHGQIPSGSGLRKNFPTGRFSSCEIYIRIIYRRRIRRHRKTGR